MLVTNFHVKRFLYTVMCSFRQLRDVAEIHPARARSLRALERTVDFIEKDMPTALGLEKQADVLKYALTQVKIEGAYCEFGVFAGGTARFIAKLIGKNQLHGFDSFEGLPEPWLGFDLGTGAFNRGGRLPKVPSNVTLHKGWFNQTIPPWKAANSGQLAFLHIDCDIYSSTKCILDNLGDRIVPGTVIVFDDYFNFPGWEIHEHKAFYEFLESHRATYEPLAYARQQIAVRIASMDGPVGTIAQAS